MQNDINRAEPYVSEIEKLYQKYTDLLIKLLLINQITLKKDTPFSFYAYTFSEIAKRRFRGMYSELYSLFKKGITNEWSKSNKKNDELVKSIQFIKDKNRYFTKTNDTLNAFFERKKDGLNLSQRVWKLTMQHKNQLELSIDAALRDGKSSHELSRDIKNLLNDPDKLFRKVRDQNNRLTLSKAAEEFPPGQGVYRSSAKNAQRLARTEINMAYRTSDVERWQNMDFVVGYEIKRSNNPYSCPVCDALKGTYPKSFKFVGWHPNCRCYMVPILMTPKEMEKLNKYIMEDRKIDWKSVNEVEALPNNMLEWIRENNERVNHAKSLPYFIRDNKEIFNHKDYYIAKSKNISGKFNSISQSIAEKTGTKVTPVSLKSEKRIIEKAKNDYNGDVTKVKDYIRNTFLANEGKQESVISEIDKKFDIVRIKKQLAKDDPLGYSGILMNVRLENGMFAEIQINSSPILYGKDLASKNIIGDTLYNKIKKISGLEPGLGHKFYEEYRILDPIKDVKRMKELEKLSKEYYELLRKLKL